VTDLHRWITQQVVRSERVARQAREDIAALAAIAITSSRFAERHIVLNDPGAVLRRCTADRKILARHRLATERAWPRNASCYGCGVMGDCDDPVTDNLNDCPELLDLAEGYGLTSETLASLDRPDPGPRPKCKPRGPVPDTRRVPPALRGSNWKGRP